MENDGLDELFAGTETPAVDSTAIDAATPEVVPPPDENAEPSAPVAAPPIEPTVAAPPEVPAPAAPAWDSPENPHYQNSVFLQQLQQAAQIAERQQQAEANRQALEGLIDGDPERGQVVGRVLQSVVAPLQQQLSQAERVSKASTAFLIAARTVLPEGDFARVLSEMDDLMAVDGAQNMERRATGKKEFLTQFQGQLSAKDTRIAELEAIVNARGELADRGNADVVDGGSGLSGLTRRQRMEQSTTDDDFFGALFGASD